MIRAKKEMLILAMRHGVDAHPIQIIMFVCLPWAKYPAWMSLYYFLIDIIRASLLMYRRCPITRWLFAI